MRCNSYTTLWVATVGIVVQVLGGIRWAQASRSGFSGATAIDTAHAHTALHHHLPTATAHSSSHPHRVLFNDGAIPQLSVGVYALALSEEDNAYMFLDSTLCVRVFFVRVCHSFINYITCERVELLKESVKN